MMVIGAGASIAAPTAIPAFDPMRNAILKSIGWNLTEDWKYFVHPELVGGKKLPQIPASRVGGRAAPAEVVFGTLHRFGLPFAPAIEALLTDPAPPYNAVHAVAAELLAAGGSVWTPNIDIAVESAFADRCDGEPDRLVVDIPSGHAVTQLTDSFHPGQYVKFHGSADMTGTLAFTDLDLLPRFPAAVAEAFGAAADGCDLVLYGYRGADADLRPLLRAAIDRADTVTWFEPAHDSWESIRASFGSKVRFEPAEAGPDFGQNVALMADRFVSFARDAGYGHSLDPALTAALGRKVTPRDLQLDKLTEVPAIVHARLVQRFGDAKDETATLNAARRADLLPWSPGQLGHRPRAVGAHLAWTASRNIYGGGLLAKAVTSIAACPPALKVLPDAVSNYVFDKAPGIMLPAGEYPRIETLAERALQTRRTGAKRGADLYYLAHALRYRNQPERARQVLLEACPLLAGAEGVADAERYAGAMFELGAVALYQGQPPVASNVANELIHGAGLYAISRWPAWGHWLASFAALYNIGCPEADTARLMSAAHSHLDEADAAFRRASPGRGNGDVYLGRLLAARVSLALGDPQVPPTPPSDLTDRQRHDQTLLLADIAIAEGRPDRAAQSLRKLLADPKASDVVRDLSLLGLAEIRHLTDGDDRLLEACALAADEKGASWLAAQARLGLTGGQRSGSLAVAVGEPRVLWLVT